VQVLVLEDAAQFHTLGFSPQLRDHQQEHDRLQRQEGLVHCKRATPNRLYADG
jgi:hypothetical protein